MSSINKIKSNQIFSKSASVMDEYELMMILSRLPTDNDMKSIINFKCNQNISSKCLYSTWYANSLNMVHTDATNFNCLWTIGHKCEKLSNHLNNANAH